MSKRDRDRDLLREVEGSATRLTGLIENAHGSPRWRNIEALLSMLGQEARRIPSGMDEEAAFVPSPSPREDER